MPILTTIPTSSDVLKGNTVTAGPVTENKEQNKPGVSTTTTTTATGSGNVDTAPAGTMSKRNGIILIILALAAIAGIWYTVKKL